MEKKKTKYELKRQGIYDDYMFYSYKQIAYRRKVSVSYVSKIINAVPIEDIRVTFRYFRDIIKYE